MKNHTLIIALLLLCSYYSTAQTSNNGAYLISIYTKANYKDTPKYGFIDTTGKIVIKAQFADEAGAFSDGLALVKTTGDNGKWGYIDPTGKFIIPPVYDYATTFSEGLAFVTTKPGVFDAIDTKGHVKFTLHARDVFNFYDGMAAFGIDTKPAPQDTLGIAGERWGFVNKEGTVQIKPQFLFVTAFSDGRSAVCNKEERHQKWGYINKNGKLVIDYQYDEAMPFKKNKAIAFKTIVYPDSVKPLFYVIDTNNNILANLNFLPDGFDADMILTRSGITGWMNMNGDTIIARKFWERVRFANRKYTAAGDKQDGEWGIINKKGAYITQPIFTQLSFLANGVLLTNNEESVILLNNSIITLKNDGIYPKKYHFNTNSDFSPSFSGPERMMFAAYSHHIGIAGVEAIQVAKKLLYAFYNQDYNECKKYMLITPMMKKQFNQFLKFAVAVENSYPTKDEKTEETTVTITSVDVQGNTVIVYYSTSSGVDNKPLLLVKQRGEWKALSLPL